MNISVARLVKIKQVVALLRALHELLRRQEMFSPPGQQLVGFRATNRHPTRDHAPMARPWITSDVACLRQRPCIPWCLARGWPTMLISDMRSREDSRRESRAHSLLAEYENGELGIPPGPFRLRTLCGHIETAVHAAVPTISSTY